MRGVVGSERVYERQAVCLLRYFLGEAWLFGTCGIYVRPALSRHGSKMSFECGLKSLLRGIKNTGSNGAVNGSPRKGKGGLSFPAAGKAVEVQDQGGCW